MAFFPPLFNCHFIHHCVAHRGTGGQFSLSVLKCRKITIIAVNGHAVSPLCFKCDTHIHFSSTKAGIGMTMQLPFDFRFMWEGAKLTFPFVRRGIVPEGELPLCTIFTHTAFSAFIAQRFQHSYCLDSLGTPVQHNFFSLDRCCPPTTHLSHHSITLSSPNEVMCSLPRFPLRKS